MTLDQVYIGQLVYFADRMLKGIVVGICHVYPVNAPAAISAIVQVGGGPDPLYVRTIENLEPR